MPFAALPVNSVVAVCEPVEKCARAVVGIMLGKKNNAFAVEHIGLSLLAVRSLKFEPESGTHELNALPIQLTLKPTPIVAGLCIDRLVIDGAHNVGSRKPPAVVLVIPNRPHFAVIKKRIDFLLISYSIQRQSFIGFTLSGIIQTI